MAQSIFFWRETEQPYGFLCQWFPSPFEENGVFFATAEHYMMFQKAVLYSDESTAARILAAKTPADAKYLAKNIDMSKDRGKRWEREKYRVVERGSYLKFSQNPALKERLLETGKSELVEASPKDRVWGIGFPAQVAEENRMAWGTNLLGLALMSVRERLCEEDNK
ncbi:hypothetical protein PRK78_007284 [Emydomyces testavorans]|uniref:NADAR domain-containing protein n=1 Tax=Emydomyces testavorans TaxID=2070801 RepID=A0AAF0DNX7_9EURO|nr:hypothetical protein PRK78_007284 [Emydomyces testavorans]